MRRYWVDSSAADSDRVDLQGDSFHHICHVCRQQVGDKFELLWGDGKAYLVELIAVQKKGATARILETRVIEPLPKPRIRLVLSLPRLQTFDWILEKSVELGVSEVLPVVSDRSFFKTLNPQISEKIPRWKKIVLSATEQCGRAELMKVSEPTGIEKSLELFNRTDGAAGLFSYEGEAELSVRERLFEMRSHNPQEVWLFVGSEGGFSLKEVELFRRFGLSPVTLGAQILRVETACVVLVSVLKYEFDLMSSSFMT